jgi:hypothetical protein
MPFPTPHDVPHMTFLSSLSRRDQRRLGTGLVVYGAAGLLLLLLTAVLVAGSLGAIIDLGATIDRQRAALIASLDATSATLGEVDLASAGVSDNVRTGATAARDAAALTTDLAAAMDELQAASGVSFLGNKPFAALGDRFAEVGTRSRAVSTSLQSLATTMDRDVTQIAAVRTSLVAARVQVDNLRGLLGGSAMSAQVNAFAVSRLILVGLLFWMAAPPALSLGAGLLLLRSAG